MSLLWYKLTLAPALVAAATVLGRRYGQIAAGLVAGLPIVAGPILYFYATDQGLPFAAAAAIATLLGLVSLSLFTVAYAWRAWSGGSVLSSLALGWVAFAAGTLIINHLLDTRAPNLAEALLFGVGSLLLALRSLPPAQAKEVLGRAPGQTPPPSTAAASPEAPVAKGVAPPADLPLRLVSTALLVWLLTHFAQALGPRLGGLLAPFPIASTVLTVFAHRQGGSEAARSAKRFAPGPELLRGVLRGLGVGAGPSGPGPGLWRGPAGRGRGPGRDGLVAAETTGVKPHP